MIFSKIYASDPFNNGKDIEITSNSDIFFRNIFTNDLFLKIILFLVVLFLTFFISRILNKKVIEYIEKKFEEQGSEVAQTFTSMLSKIITFSVWFIGLSIILSILGLDIRFFMGRLGLGIGFTLQVFLSNFFYGIIMVIQGTIKNGDLIEIQGKKYFVLNIKALFTVVKGFDGIISYIPNINFLTNHVSNITVAENARLDVELFVDYNTDISKLKFLIDKVLKTVPNILFNPSPSIWFEELGSRGIKIQILFWYSVSDVNPFILRSNFVETLSIAFKQAGIKVPAEKISITQKEYIYNNKDNKISF